MKLEKISFNAFNLIEDDNHDYLIEIIKSSEPINNQDIMVKLYLKEDHYIFTKYFPYTEENRNKLLHILEIDYNEYEDRIIEFMEFIKIEDL